MTCTSLLRLPGFAVAGALASLTGTTAAIAQDDKALRTWQPDQWFEADLSDTSLSPIDPFDIEQMALEQPDEANTLVDDRIAEAIKQTEALLAKKIAEEARELLDVIPHEGEARGIAMDTMEILANLPEKVAAPKLPEIEWSKPRLGTDVTSQVGLAYHGFGDTDLSNLALSYKNHVPMVYQDVEPSFGFARNDYSLDVGLMVEEVIWGDEFPTLSNDILETQAWQTLLELPWTPEVIDPRSGMLIDGYWISNPKVLASLAAKSEQEIRPWTHVPPRKSPPPVRSALPHPIQLLFEIEPGTISNWSSAPDAVNPKTQADGVLEVF